MNDDLDDPRDKTIFLEYFPDYVLGSVWNSDGTLQSWSAREYGRPYIALGLGVA